jgi:hypothetical protein
MGRTLRVTILGLIVGVIVSIILFEDRGPGLTLEQLLCLVAGVGIAVLMDVFVLRRRHG